MPQPDVTVLVAVHNGERYVGEMVESVLGQTLANFEFIVVDDGSTDATPDIVAGFKDPRIRLLRPGRSGISRSLNLGLRQAQAPLIARTDGDDVMEPHRLERQLAFMHARPEIGGAASYYRIIDAQSHVRGAYELPMHEVGDVERHLKLGGWLIYPHPTVIFWRDLALALGGYDHAFDVSEDVEFFVRMAEVGRPLLVQPEYLMRVRYHSGSLTARNARRQLQANEVIFENYRRRSKGLPTITPEEYAAALQRWPARLRFAAKLQSRLALRRRDERRMSDEHLAALAEVALAGVLDPAASLKRLRRSLGRALAG